MDIEQTTETQNLKKSGYRDLSKITCLSVETKDTCSKLQRRVLPHSRAKAEGESISQERDGEWQS